MVPDTVRVVAHVSLDCASKQRVRYLLPGPVTEELLGQFEPQDVQVNRFSAVAKGAKDHFSLHWPGAMAAGGVLAERRIVATYGKFGRHDGHAAARARFEGELERYYACSVETLSTSAGVAAAG